MEQANAEVSRILAPVKVAWETGEVTATELGRRTGRSSQTVGRALRGEIDPPSKLAQAYADALKKIRAERIKAERQARVATVQAHPGDEGLRIDRSENVDEVPEEAAG